MKKTQFMVIIFCLLITFIIAGCGGVDHYKVYYAEGGEVRQDEVNLKDQFVTSKAMLSPIQFFANPVSKNNGKIYDPQTHLTWYQINEHESQIRREVTFINQFGPQTWIIGKAVFLLVPTEKIEEGSSGRNESKHFKCYEVLSGKSLDKEVKLIDQFDKQPQNVVVGKPLYFCTPVQKNDGKAINKHLACYEITSMDNSRSIKINNQFEKETKLDIKKSYMLCVPSDKKEFKELDKL